ncbi:acetylornithine deacetylase [candidate division BRC1 bacterium HGW-BRC1-1]|jgi:acetylornithine deacetylase|nr:MAG: acetylornithine deacetylase [candidate division BRC1 bacterium HGW-BRC1-1]
MASEYTNIVDLARDLVAIPSVNPMGRDDLAGTGELALAEHVAEFLRSIGAEPQISWPLPSRPNLWAFLDLGAPDTILFEAHLDTVPVDNMTIDPYGAEVREGRLWGRGACDTKGPMAAMLWAIAQAAKQNSCKHNVLFCAVMDEEYQFTGVQYLLDNLPSQTLEQVALAIIAEPTLLLPVTAHKGVMRWNAITQGKSAHSSTPQLGENAIYKLAHAVCALEEHAATLAKFSPHPLLGFPTLSVGTIQGGTAVNVVPDHATAKIDRRLIPGEDPAGVTQALRSLLAAYGAELTDPIMQAPAFEIPNDHPAVQAALAAARMTGVNAPAPLAVNYATDAAFYPAHNIPAVVFGPGDIAQAHTKDEWINLEELERGSRAYAALILGRPLT